MLKVQVFGVILRVMVVVKVFIRFIPSLGRSLQFFLGEGKGTDKFKCMRNGRELGKMDWGTLVNEWAINVLQRWQRVWTELLYKIGFHCLQNLKIAPFKFPFFFLLFCNSFWIETDTLLFRRKQMTTCGVDLLTQRLKVWREGDKKWISFVEWEIMQILEKVLVETCKALIGFITFFKRLLCEHYPLLTW